MDIKSNKIAYELIFYVEYFHPVIDRAINGTRPLRQAHLGGTAEGRISNQELADRIGLSPSPCLRRVKALEEGGVALDDNRDAGLLQHYFGDPDGVWVSGLPPGEIALAAVIPDEELGSHLGDAVLRGPAAAGHGERLRHWVRSPERVGQVSSKFLHSGGLIPDLSVTPVRL